MMTSADLAHMSLPWVIHKELAQEVYKEFYHQVKIIKLTTCIKMNNKCMIVCIHQLHIFKNQYIYEKVQAKRVLIISVIHRKLLAYFETLGHCILKYVVANI